MVRIRIRPPILTLFERFLDISLAGDIDFKLYYNVDARTHQK